MPDNCIVVGNPAKIIKFRKAVSLNIPFVDLKAQYKSIKAEIDNSIKAVIDDAAFIKGKYVRDFEDSFANIYGVENVVSCANGTDAIYIALKALNIGHGDEVITVANSWISTSETITQAGAKPIFVDIKSDFFTIDTSKIEEKIKRQRPLSLFIYLGIPWKWIRLLIYVKIIIYL